MLLGSYYESDDDQEDAPIGLTGEVLAEELDVSEGTGEDTSEQSTQNYKSNSPSSMSTDTPEELRPAIVTDPKVSTRMTVTKLTRKQK